MSRDTRHSPHTNGIKRLKKEVFVILLASHLERELSIVGNLASNNPTLTSLKSQWQSWDWLQILKKVKNLKIAPS